MKEFFAKAGEKIKNVWKYSIHTWIFRCFVVSFFLEMIMEMLGRRSIVEGFSFLIDTPLVFIYNVSIVFFTMLFALLLKKRVFGMIFISAIWLACGIVNFVVLGYRVTPFAAIDFLMAKDVLSMLDVYFTKWQQVLLVVAGIFVIGIIVFLFRKTPKIEGKRKITRTMIECAVVWVFVIVFTKFAVKHNIISDDFANLGMAYEDYGFAYCFTNSIIDNGISEPEDYSQEKMEEIKASVSDVTSTGKEKNPNIIYIQLESFFDPKTVTNLELSSDPVPNFTKYKEEYPSGYLTVPALGAGTANTEFEMITSLRSSSFGAGEYPYKTTVNKEQVVSICSQLQNEGYGTYAIHNNKASFYDRNNVYNQMGFDAFVSLEYMYNVETTSTGWAKDKTLVDDIMKCLKETEGTDLVYTISVQGHGKYPDGEDTCTDHIQIEYEDEEMQQPFHYYVNQIYEMDEMIADLKEQLDAYGENYVLVLYGDHLPSLNLTEEQLSSGNLFQTEYVVVNNINLQMDDEDLCAYEFSGRLMQALHKPLTAAQQITLKYSGDEEIDDLNYLAYDMLFGDDYYYDGTLPIEAPHMQMGVTKITATEAKNEEDHIVVKGENFNKYSTICINGDAEDTVYIDKNTLMVEDENLEIGDEVTVSQIDASHNVLSTTDAIIADQ